MSDEFNTKNEIDGNDEPVRASVRLFINEVDAVDILRQLQPDAPFPAIADLAAIELIIQHEETDDSAEQK